MIRSMGRQTRRTAFQRFDTLVISAIKKTSDSLYQPTLAKRGKMPAQPFLLKDRSNAEDVFCPQQTSERWTDIHDSGVTKWHRSFLLLQESRAPSHRRMETSTIKRADQPIEMIVGLLACRVLKICKLQSFLHITCRSNYL